MNTIKNTWDNYQAKRIDHLLNWPTSRFLSNPWVKRFLAATAVISSWMFLILLTPGLFRGFDSPVPYLLLSGIIMISSFMLLRQSVRRITSLPDDYLDEREIENRDWAYRLGYLVVRRIGLFATAGLIVFSILIKFGSYSVTIDSITDFPDSPFRGAYQEASDFIRAYFALTPLENILMIMILLTYVAYSFPVILLAWREAKMQPVVQPLTSWQDTLRRYSKGYFSRLIRIVWLLPISLFLVIGHLQDFWFNLILLTQVYVLYAFLWALVIQFEVLGKLKPFAREDSGLNKKRRDLQVLAYAVVVIASTIVISTVLVGLYKTNPYANVAMLALFVLQVVSFGLVSRMSKTGGGSK
jgi:hypothetical protein